MTPGPVVDPNHYDCFNYKKGEFMRLLLLIPLFLIGCATSGTVEEKMEPTVSFNQYQDLYLRVSTDKTELKSFVKPVTKAVASQIKVSQTFPKVRRKIASKEGLVLKLKLMSFEQGSSFARMFNMGGEAKLKAEGHLYDLKTKKKIGVLDIEGTSLEEKQTSVSVGGIPVHNSKWGNNGLDARTTMAIESLSIYLAKYFQDKKSS